MSSALKRKARRWSCAEYDLRRRREVFIYLHVSLLCLVLACTSLLGPYRLFVIFLWGGTVFLFLGISALRAGACLRRGRALWRWADRGVLMEAPRTIVAWELLPWGGAVFGVLGMVVLSGADGSAYAARKIGGAAIAALAYLIIIVWNGGPVTERICLSGEGLRLTRMTGENSFVPWTQRPLLAGVECQRLIIDIRGHRDYLKFPVTYLPLSCQQVERLLEAFSRKPALRGRLDDPDALQVVLGILEPTEEEYASASWTWSRPTLGD